MAKPEPGTGALTFMVEPERASHSCEDCAYLRRDTGIPRCGALGGRYAEDIRTQLTAKGVWTCPVFHARRRQVAPQPPGSELATRRPGWLRRLLNWIWVVP